MTISPQEFKDALRHFPAGVTLVTAGRGDDVHGLTVSAFASVSADPPMIVVILDLRNHIHPFLEAEHATFAVSFLGSDQEALSNRFAFEPQETRFGEGRWTPAPGGTPVLDDAVAWLECTVESRLEAGSHILYVGRVQASQVRRPDAEPLVYWNRGYRQLEGSEDSGAQGE